MNLHVFKVAPDSGRTVIGRVRRGFTLIELLAVMVIMSLLIALATPAVLNALGSTSLTTAGDLVRNKLTQAQQEAIAKNSPVEVRFYYYDDRDFAGFGEFVRAFQMFQLTNDPDNPLLRLGEPIYLEGGIVLSADDELSTFPDFAGAASDTEGDRTRSTPVGGAKDRRFRFLPDGSTDLPGNSRWFVTALDDRAEEQLSSGGERPANFYTIQIDPITGSLRTFRPGE